MHIWPSLNVPVQMSPRARDVHGHGAAHHHYDADLPAADDALRHGPGALRRRAHARARYRSRDAAGRIGPIRGFGDRQDPYRGSRAFDLALLSRARHGAAPDRVPARDQSHLARPPVVSKRLYNAVLDDLPAAVRRPAYVRDELEAGIVHLSVGALHRAPQAVYTDDAIETTRTGTPGLA